MTTNTSTSIVRRKSKKPTSAELRSTAECPVAGVCSASIVEIVLVVRVVLIVVDIVEVVVLIEVVEVVEVEAFFVKNTRLHSMQSNRVCYSSRVRQVVRMISISISMLSALQSTSFKPSISASAKQFSPCPPLGWPNDHGRKGNGCPAFGPSVSTQLPSIAASDPDT